jgi:dTDP-4-dehydrorhamnose 3,5-epimerase
MLYLPAGLAHGFCSISELSLMVYKVTSTYAPQHDGGILWNSAGIPWPPGQPVISARDLTFPTLAEFDTPFIYGGAPA